MGATLNPNIDTTKLNVLIVDDIPLNVLLIEKMLSKFKFHTMKAGNGQIALDTVASQPVDIVLLDLMMPEVDGYEVLRRLRADEKTATLPVVILSALNSNDDVAKGFQLGANDFITKPIIMERLLNCITEQINAISEGRFLVKG